MKKYEVLTENQKKWLGEYTRNGGNASEAARKVYNCTTDASYRNLGKTTKESLQRKLGEDFFESLGLTKEMIIEALVKDIKGKPKNRVAELTLAAKLRGDLTEKKQVAHSGSIAFEDYLEEIDESEGTSSDPEN
jgi:hypothetical protein